jgi:hypothetical protein
MAQLDEKEYLHPLLLVVWRERSMINFVFAGGYSLLILLLQVLRNKSDSYFIQVQHGENFPPALRAGAGNRASMPRSVLCL